MLDDVKVLVSPNWQRPGALFCNLFGRSESTPARTSGFHMGRAILKSFEVVSNLIYRLFGFCQ